MIWKPTSVIFSLICRKPPPPECQLCHSIRRNLEFSKIEGKFIICVKKDYAGLVDDVFPDQLPKQKLEEIDTLYRKFSEFTNCDCLILETDDHNLDRQTSEIMKFLGVQPEVSVNTKIYFK